ncbi:MAG: sugar phosphate nucleotidyltransferase [Candidatus Binatia bacterium]
MKGIILAGGTGTRLHPLTKITNKHLLPVYDRPMIYYPLETLVEAGIEDIMIVTGGNHAGEFLKLLGNGREFGLKHLNYAYQERAGGIAEALGLTEHFAAGEKVVVMLGDNLLQGSLRDAAAAFEAQSHGAKIMLKEVDNPREYGVAEMRGEHVVGIEEKPREPKSSLAVIGVYFYDGGVYDVVRTLEPSLRGELEITDVNNAYIERGDMTSDLLEGWWGDAGESIDALLRVSNLVAETRAATAH